MKVLAVVLLCAVAAVQGRSAGVQRDEDTQPQRGVVPYLVHLRLAIGTSGLLETGVGSLISNNWVLTAASAVEDSRFIWIRFGAEFVVNPALVIESNDVRRNPDYNSGTGDNNLALINTNRNLEPQVNYAPVSGLGVIFPSIVVYYGYGQDENGRPGDRQLRFELEVDENEDGVVSGTSVQGPIAKYDIGAPIVSDDGQQVALLSSVNSAGVGQFLLLNDYIGWVNDVTNLELGPSKA